MGIISTAKANGLKPQFEEKEDGSFIFYIGQEASSSGRTSLLPIDHDTKIGNGTLREAAFGRGDSKVSALRNFRAEFSGQELAYTPEPGAERKYITIPPKRKQEG